MSSTVAVCGMLTVLEIAPRDERLDRAHHLDVAHVRDRALADRHVEHRQVLVAPGPGAPTIVPCSSMCASICSICCVVVAERLQRQRHRAVDDRHLAAADELLELDEREVGLDAGRVAVHQERDRPRRREHRRLRVAVAVALAERDRLVPRARARRRAAASSAQRRVRDRVRRVAVHPHDVVVRLAVLRVALVRADRRGDLAPTARTRGRSSAP